MRKNHNIVADRRLLAKASQSRRIPLIWVRDQAYGSPRRAGHACWTKVEGRLRKVRTIDRMYEQHDLLPGKFSAPGELAW